MVDLNLNSLIDTPKIENKEAISECILFLEFLFISITRNPSYSGYYWCSTNFAIINSDIPQEIKNDIQNEKESIFKNVHLENKDIPVGVLFANIILPYFASYFGYSFYNEIAHLHNAICSSMLFGESDFENKIKLIEASKELREKINLIRRCQNSTRILLTGCYLPAMSLAEAFPRLFYLIYFIIILVLVLL